MPCRAMEPTLAEDTAAGQFPVIGARKEGWSPDPEVWTLPLSRALPDLEGALRRWPADPDLWKAWVSWAAILPGAPAPADFADSLPVAVPRGRWLCTLPREVHEAVLNRFGEARREDRAVSWFQAAWDGLQGALEELPPQAAAEQVDLLFHLLRKARAAAGLPPELQALEAQRQALLAELKGSPEDAAAAADPLEGLLQPPQEQPIRKRPARPRRARAPRTSAKPGP